MSRCTQRMIVLPCFVVLLLLSSVISAQESAPAEKTDEVGIENKERPVDLGLHLKATRARNQKLLERIENQRVTLELNDTPLNEALDRIARQSGIPILLDTVAIEEAGILIDEPISVRIKNARPGSALEAPPE